MPPDTPPADSPRDESTLRRGAPTIRDQPATVDIAVPGSTRSALPVDQHVWQIMGIGMLAVVVPLLLELIGVVPPSFQFDAGRLVLLPRMIDIPPVPTILLLLIGNIAMVLVPSLIVGRLRDQATDTKRTLVAHLARLRQLVPEAARDRDAAT